MSAGSSCRARQRTAEPNGSSLTRAAPEGVPAWLQRAMVGGVTADEAAAIALAGMRAERFLITTGDDTLEDLQRKAVDFDAWIQRLQGWHDELQPDIGPNG